jgi:hypothetical protein
MLREDPDFGERLSREQYERQIRERDQEWIGAPQQAEPTADHWEKAYRTQEAVWQV